MNIIFFGSTSDSVIVLTRLMDNNYILIAVVTQPPAPLGRKQIITPTPVEMYAKAHNIPVTSFQTNREKPWLYQQEEAVINSISTFKPDLLVSASYGQKIPTEIIKAAKFGGLNVHPSLLPKWRGADPVPWTILSDERQTGVTIVTISEKFDQGRIISQKKYDMLESDVADRVRATLFTLGADLLIESLPDYLSGKNKGIEQKVAQGSVARKLTRDDGYEPWDAIQKTITNTDETARIYRKYRAFIPWPGVWTRINIKQEEKRLKIIEAHIHNGTLIIDTVQLEGKTPVSWKQFEKSYLKN